MCGLLTQSAIIIAKHVPKWLPLSASANATDILT